MLTVVTPPTSRKLTTVERVKALANVGALPDSAIEILIDQVSIAIPRYCGVEFAQAEVIETFRRAGARLRLSRAPVVGDVVLTVDGSVVASDGYVLWAAEGVIEGGVRLYCHRDASVAYTAGYKMPGEQGADLPADVERAAILLVAAYASSSARDPNLRSENVDGVGSFSWATGENSVAGALPSAEAMALLRPYRVPVFA